MLEREELRKAGSTAESALQGSQYSMKLLTKQLERSHARRAVLEEELKEYGTVPRSRTDIQWAELSPNARRMAAMRERLYVQAFLNSNNFRMVDLVDVIAAKEGKLAELFNTKQVSTRSRG